MINQPVRIASFLIIGAGVILFALNAFLGGSLNIALPLVFLMLGGFFYILAYRTRENWSWASILFLPGSLLLALGLIFLVNVLTDDWNAWAYAWLLLATGLGVGLLLAGRDRPWPGWVSLAGWGLTLGGITLFALFGAIVSGKFIKAVAPILLILGGLSLRWLHLDALFSEQILQRFHPANPAPVSSTPTPDQGNLVEPLSARELEVLHLVDLGLSNQQIAAKLNVATSTVKTHINNIYGKLDVQTRVQAIHRARDLGLIDS